MGYEILQLNSSNVISNKAYGINNSFLKNGVFTPLYKDIEQAYANLKQLLQTVPGERMYHPSYGCALLSVARCRTSVTNWVHNSFTFGVAL